MGYHRLFDTLTRKRRLGLAHALIDNWWVDHPNRPDERVLERLHAEIDRAFAENPAVDPDRAFHRARALLATAGG